MVGQGTSHIIILPREEWDDEQDKYDRSCLEVLTERKRKAGRRQRMRQSEKKVKPRKRYQNRRM